MDRREAHHHAVHHEVHAKAVEQAADDRLVDHEFDDPTREEINCRPNQSDEEMEEETEGGSFQAAGKSARAERAPRHRLENPDRRNVVAQSEKDEGVSNVEGSSQQAGNENRQQRFGRTSRVSHLFLGTLAVAMRRENITNSPGSAPKIRSRWVATSCRLSGRTSGCETAAGPDCLDRSWRVCLYSPQLLSPCCC